jgi:hypothetical protein
MSPVAGKSEISTATDPDMKTQPVPDRAANQLAARAEVHLESRFWVKTLLMGAGLCFVRIPFVATHHIQDDAYISFRCARMLVEHGVYGFNPGQRVSASTSHLYVFLCAAVRLVVGEAGFLPAILTLNVVALVGATWLLSRRLAITPGRQMLLWCLASCMPVAQLISYAGMETPWLVLLISVIVHETNVKRPIGRFSLLALFLLPWCRPDAVAIGLILLAVAWVHSRSQWRALVVGVLSIALGAATVGWFNYCYFGNVLYQTIIAKSTLRHVAARSWAEIGSGIASAYLQAFCPLETKYLPAVGIIGLLIVALVGTIYLLSIRNRPESLPAQQLMAVALVLPAAYGCGGVLFPWYFWPGNYCANLGILAAVAAVIGAIRWPAFRAAAWLASSCAIAALTVVQWCISLNVGTQEFYYRASIGRYIKETAQPGDRLLLEPAGYIPFYAGCYTYDEPGLVSPAVTAYRRRYGPPWWFYFVRDLQPEFLVQRDHMLGYVTCLDDYHLSEEQQRWFHAHYERIRDFRYNPADYWSDPRILSLLRMGSAGNYHVYRVRPLH